MSDSDKQSEDSQMNENLKNDLTLIQRIGILLEKYFMKTSC
jgi:hypothetical protein